jgi:translocation and assembly module TamB
MTAAGANSRRRRIWKYLLILVSIGVLLVAGMAWYATTSSFQAMVRRRLVAELEKITGGRVELGSFHTSPFRFRVEVRDLTIHGREGPGEVPYAHVERVVAEIKIISVLGAEFGFHSLVLDHPVVHVLVYPDGTTNQPAPRLQTSGETPVEQLFRLSISRLEVRGGQVLWNDQRIPVDFVVDDVSADMTYSLLHRRYISNLLLGKIVTRLGDYRPFAWMLEAHFNLGANSLEVNLLKASSGRSHLEARGRLRDLRHPELEATYDAQLDLAEAAAILRQPEIERGSIEARGSGSWLLQHWSASGTFAAKDLAWHDRSVHVSNVAVDAGFSVTPERLTVSRLQARLLRGSVTGDADILGWLHPGRVGKVGKGRMGEEQKGMVRLRMKDISAGALAAVLSTPARPLEAMNLAANGTGTLDLHWTGSLANLEAGLTVDVVAPPSTSPGQLPLNGRARLSYRGATGALEVAELRAATRASQVQASGTLADSGALKLSLTTSDLGEWHPVLVAFGNPSRIPAVLHGRASFNGTASGTLPYVTLAGHLQAEDFDYLIPATDSRPEQPVHWDALSADLQFSQHAVAVRNGTLGQGDAAITFTLNASLDRGRFTAQSPFSGRVEVRGADVAAALALLKYSYPVQGTMDLSVALSGTRAQPQGTGRLLLRNAKIYGEPVEQLDAGLRFTGGEIQLNAMQIAYYESRVSGAASYNFLTRAFRFDLSGTNFDLVHLPRNWASRFKVEGHMNFTAQGSGTPEEPSINAIVRLRDLTFDHERTGDFTVQAVTRGPELRLVGQSQFETGDLKLEGNVHLRDNWPATAKIQFSQLDVDAILRPYLGGRLTGHSSVSGTLQLEGPLAQPRDLSLAGTLGDFSINLENVQLRNGGPLKFAISGQVLRLEGIRLVGDNTDLSASGTVQLTGDRGLDLHAQGSVNLLILETFDSEFVSSGTVRLDMTVAGTVLRPIAQGRLEVSNGAIAHLDLPNAFSDINGSLLFSQNRLRIETLTAHTGGGLVTFEGSATWYNQLNFDLTLREQDVRLRYPLGVSSTADAELRFAGTAAASTLSGDITVTKLSVTPGFDFGAYLARSARATVLPPTNPTLNRIRLDVHIVTTPELQMQTAVVHLSGEADLRLRGTAAKPVLLGRADILEGQVYFNGSKYELERGEVAFRSPVTTTPELDLQATTHIRDYDITLSLNGEPNKLRVTYRSEPPLPEADIITLLALGRTTTEESAQAQSGQSSFTQDASSAIINQALNATVSNRAQSLFGVSRIKVDPEGLNTETTVGRGPLVTIEQQVSNNLTLTYSTSVEQASQQIIQVEYNLTHNISLVGLRDQDGVVSFDVRIRRRKK